MNLLELFVTIKADDQASSRIAGIANSVKSGMGAAARAAGVATAAIATGVTAFGKSAIDAGMTFDSSMSQVAATMGMTMDEMQKEVGTVDLAWGTFSGNLRDYAQEMGAHTAFSATQAADALNYMALAGYDTQTSMEMLPNVLNLAAAGSMDLATASDMVTDTQTAFGISLERTSQMVDEMAKASSTGNTSVQQLGDAFLTVGGLAQELNGGMVQLSDGTTASVDGVQELEIALTAMANAGIKGSEAGTHMRNMLLKLSSPTDDGTMALQEMGVAVFDTEGKMRSLADIFSDLSGELDKMSQEQKIQVISTLFNTRDLASAEALLNAVGQDWDKIGESILDAEGAAQKMADTQLDNLAGDITLFQSAMEGFQIAISDMATGSLREIVQFGSDAMSRLTTALKEGGVDAMMEEMNAIIQEGIAKLSEGLPGFIEAGVQIVGSILMGLVQATPTLITGLAQSLADLLNTMADNTDEMMEGAGQLFGSILEALANAQPVIFEATLNLLGSIIQYVIEHAPEMLAAAGELMMQLVQGIVDGMTPTMESMNQVVQGALDTALGFLGGMLDAGAQLIQSVIDGIMSGIDGIASGVSDGIQNAVDTIGNFFGDMFDAGSHIIDGLIDGLWDGFDRAVDAVNDGLDWVRSYLPFSPAKRGPFSGKGWTLYSGRSMMEGLAEGFVDASAQAGRDIESAMQGIGGVMEVEPRINAISAGANGVARQPQVVININDPVIKEEADVDRIFDYVQQKVRRQASTWQPSYSMA